MTRSFVALFAALLAVGPIAANDTLVPDACDGSALRVQVLGSGGADLADGRAAGAYLIWIDNKARILIDAGPGSALRFAESGARAADLDAILFTQLRMDHTLDFPALIAAALREGRTRSLPLFGPTGNRLAPSTMTFVRALLDGTRGAYRHLSRVLSPLAKDGFKLEPHDVRTRTPAVGVRRGKKEIVDVALGRRFQAAATYMTEEGPPVLAWRVRNGARRIVVTGDLSGEAEHLERLARASDLLIVDQTLAPDIAVSRQPVIRSPAVIGQMATQVGAKGLILAQRTAGDFGEEPAALAEIRKNYAGPVAFADDLDCFVLP